MRTLVIFAFAAAALIAATSAAPSSSKLTSAHNLVAIFAKLQNHAQSARKTPATHAGHSESEIIKQAITSTAHITKSLAYHQYQLKVQEAIWNDSERYQKAEEWRSKYYYQLLQAWIDCFFDSLFDGYTLPVIEGHAKTAVAKMETTVLEAVAEMFHPSQDIVTFYIMYSMVQEVAERVVEVTDEVADLWVLIKGGDRAEVQRPIKAAKKTLDQLATLKDTQQLRNFFADLHAQSVDTLTRTLDVTFNMLLGMEDLINEVFYGEKYDEEDFWNALYVFGDGMSVMSESLYQALSNSYDAQDEAEVDALVDTAMKEFEVTWVEQIIPEAKVLTPGASEFLGRYVQVLDTWLYRYTDAMEPLVKLFRKL